MRRILFALLIASVASALQVKGQMWDKLAVSDYRIDSTDYKALKFELDNITFFHDNEYKSTLTTGYSLPGLWMQPKLTYVPHRQIGLEVGCHALLFNGANKYPCYAYHDIGVWKGDQYQSGFHVLPWFRVKAQFSHLTIVLGNIYGGQNHGLIEPLFNSELNISQDPEMGFQMLWDREHLHSDTWLNWQSYIFDNASHQEAFTVGSNWRVLFNKENSNVHWYMPAQLVLQHRGGEQDTTHMGVQTLVNMSLGAGMKWNANKKVLTSLGAEVDYLLTYQQAGELWPFSGGCAYHGMVSAELAKCVSLSGGFFRSPNNFASLYGNHFFSTISSKNNINYRGISTAYLHLGYSHVFSKSFVLGAEAEGYQSWMGGDQEFNFSFGIYFRVNPSILIKKFRQ